MYVVVRKDLKPGSMLAQGIHAALVFSEEHKDITSEWRKDSEYLAVLEAQNETELQYITDIASTAGIKFSIFREPDLNNQMTAVVFEPGQVSKRILRMLPLAMRDLK